VIFLLSLYILYRGLLIVGDSDLLKRNIEKWAVNTYLTGFVYGGGETGKENTWLDFLIRESIPVLTFAGEQIQYMPEIESRLEYEMLVKAEEDAAGSAGEEITAHHAIPETESETKKSDDTGESDMEPETISEESEKTEAMVEAMSPDREPIAEISMEKLQSFDYLLNNYYVVDPSTTIDGSQLNLETLTSRDMKLESDSSAPQILIYHTHSQEAFIDSIEGDESTTIMGVGDRLTEILQDAYGYNVIHHRKVYDMIDGELDRNMAYTLAAPDIQQILDENPSIEVVIDLHRDGAREGIDRSNFATEIDGKPTAKIMFFNGLSKTARNGPIEYLYNPYIEDNLAFSFQLQLKAAQYYPGLMRKIYLKSLRYNLHLKPKALLIECGAQINTVEEEKNAMEPLADILNQVLRGK